MKFRFCGDGDCPDWVLTEIPTLTLLTSIKMKLLCGLVAKSLAGEDFDFERARGLTVDAKLGETDVHGAVAALRWLLGSAARYSQGAVQAGVQGSRHGVDAESFSSELQQLGLPREHAQAAAKVFGENLALITTHLKSKSLRVSALEDASCHVVPAPAGADSSSCRRYSLSLTLRDGIADKVYTRDVKMTQLQLQELLAELNRAKAMMEG